MIIDCHAHLYYDEILKDIDNVLERAVNAGIEKIIVPSVDLKTAEQILFLADKYSMIYAAVGFHPCDIAGFNPGDVRLLENFVKHPKVLAVGEIGAIAVHHGIDASRGPVEIREVRDKPVR